jgi:signal transduction histidine kinase
MELLDRLTLIARASAIPASVMEVDMGMTVWAARERLAKKIAEADAHLTEPEEWPTVMGVREWLERIWLNLIANALQHAGPKPRIELGWAREDTELRFFVRDRGAGVPIEIQESLFRPFHRLHEKDSGRGLGLPIVQRLVELHGGSCGYEPASPQGSCFSFSIPVTGSG